MAAQEAGIVQILLHVVELGQAAMAGSVRGVQQHRMIAAFQIHDVAEGEIAPRCAHPKRQSRLARRQNPIENTLDGGRVERLHEVVGRTHLVAFHRMLARDGEEHDGNRRVHRAQRAGRRHAVHAFEVHVEEHQIERISVRRIGYQALAGRVLLVPSPNVTPCQRPVQRTAQIASQRSVIIADRYPQTGTSSVFDVSLYCPMKRVILSRTGYDAKSAVFAAGIT